MILQSDTHRKRADTSRKKDQKIFPCLNVVVTQRATVFQLFSGENQSLLIRRDTLLVLDLRLHIVDGVRRLHVESDGLPREGLHKDLDGYFLCITISILRYCQTNRRCARAFFTY